MLDQKQTQVFRSNSVTGDRHLMLFDLSIRGHHPSYIQYLIQYWLAHELVGYISIVVSPQFIKEHADVVALTEVDSCRGICFIAISLEEERALNSRKSRLTRASRSFQEWKLFCRYAEETKATAALLMYLDTFQRPIALGMRSPCPFSGLYFRPSFHYGNFMANSPSLRMRFQMWQEKAMIAKVLRHPDWQTLYSMDPLVLTSLEKFHSRAKVVYLPDPIELHETDSFKVSALRQQLSIEPGRRIFLLFGALTTRKGVYQLLDAVSLLSSDLCKELCILLVGESSLQESLEVRIKELSDTKPVQFIQKYMFVPDSDVPDYFQLADVALATYQKHVGSSGILLWAAAAQKPVLSSDYGLMGEQVRRHRLGIVVDSTVPAEIAKGLEQFLRQSFVGDADCMKTFALQNSVEQYAQTIFQHIF